MTCGTCKHEEVRDAQPCTGCNHGGWWEPKETKPQAQEPIGYFNGRFGTADKKGTLWAQVTCYGALPKAGAKLYGEPQAHGEAWVWNPASTEWEKVRAFGHWQQGAIYAFGSTQPEPLAHPQATEPAGYKLVPVEPTLEMCVAGSNYMNSRTVLIAKNAHAFYKAMVAAAPEQKP